MQQDFDRLFDEAFRNFGLPRLHSELGLPGPSQDSGSAFRPSLNVSSDGDNYQITVETPGLSRDDLAIEVKGDVLTISGQKQERSEEKDRHFYRIERSYCHFQRVLSLPD